MHAFGACTPIRCYVVPCCFLLARARAERSCTQGAVTCLSAAVPGAFRRVLGCHHEERSEAGSPMGAVQRPLGCRRGICFWLSGGCPILRAVREGWVRARLWRVHADRCPSHLAAAALVAQGAATCFSVAGPGAFLRVFGVITRSQRRGICFCFFGRAFAWHSHSWLCGPVPSRAVIPSALSGETGREASRKSKSSRPHVPPAREESLRAFVPRFFAWVHAPARRVGASVAVATITRKRLAPLRVKRS